MTTQQSPTFEEKRRFFETTLGNPRRILAPMVDGSDAAFRAFVRSHGVDLCYTPMVYSKQFVKDKTYRKEVVASIAPGEHPLVIQIVGNDPTEMRRTAKTLQRFGDAIDINLGCPQTVARKGGYGAFLAEDLAKTEAVVREVVSGCDKPVFAKIRVFDDEAKTLRYAEMLQSCGVWALCVHGRTKAAKESLTTPVDWPIIGKIKQRLSIPVIANGGVKSLADEAACRAATGADAVMSGLGLLFNPALFEGRVDDNLALAREFLQLARELQATVHVGVSVVKGHLIKMLLSRLRGEQALLKQIGDTKTWEGMALWLDAVEEAFARKRAAPPGAEAPRPRVPDGKEASA